MRGISEERLRQFRNDFADRSDKRLMEYVIREGCQELNQWMPIESAPKDRHVLLHISVGPIDCRNFVGNAHDSLPWKPTHWQELPPSPELPEQPK